MRNVHHWGLIGLFVLLVVGFWAGETVAESGTLAGTITYAGEAPAVKELRISKDQQVCGKDPHFEETLILSGDKEVKNVVVSITNISEGDLGSLGTDFSLDQNGCIFSPHVQLLPVGVPIKIYNNDGILHNVHTQSEKNRAFNVAQPKFRKKVVKKFDAAERIRVKCDVHGWMQAFIVVIDHPFHAITGESGGYVIQGIPAGKYEIEFWHETLGNQVKEVEVAAGTETKLDLVYQADEK